MSDLTRLGVIGLGWWGGVLSQGVVDSGLGEIVACFARSQNRRMEFSSKFDCHAAESLDELLGEHELDGVLIATPHTTHAGLAKGAAEAGIHVFVDKPLTLTVADADAVIDAANKAGVVLQVGHNRRRQPANRRIRRMIDDGELGEVHHLEANHSAPLLLNPALSAWRRSSDESPAGGMTALGVHQVDTFQYLAGPVANVYAMSRRLLPDGEVEDTTAVVLEFESGALGQLVTSQATGPAVDVQVHGTEGSARNLGDGASLTLQRRGNTELEQIEVEKLDTIRDEMAEFCRAIRGEARPETDGPVGRSVVAVLEAVVESAASGRPIAVQR